MYDAVGYVYEGEFYCPDCLPEEADPDSDEVGAVFPDGEWDYYPTCAGCGEVCREVTLTREGKYLAIGDALARLAKLAEDLFPGVLRFTVEFDGVIKGAVPNTLTVQGFMEVKEGESEPFILTYSLDREDAEIDFPTAASEHDLDIAVEKFARLWEVLVEEANLPVNLEFDF